MEQLRVKDSPLEHLARLAQKETEQQLRDFLGGFGFNGDQALDKVENFSGGEKARLVLALLVWQKPNLLLLDEPTNHLDLDMRLALTMALQEFAGAMIIVSHDRHILRSTCDDFYLVDNGQVEPFQGDLEDYEKWLTEQQSSQQNDKTTNDKAHSAANKKETKRREAEFRQKTKPLRQQIDKYSKIVDKLQAQLDDIEAKLADTELYTDENKSILTDLIKSQANVKSELEKAEESWMYAEEALENAQTEFDQS